MKTRLIIFFTLLAYVGFSQKQVLFKEATNLYNEGKFTEAIDNYQKILDGGYHSSELYYNLANAYYKISEIAPSIYYYEKALTLNPDDKEIKNNLEFAQTKTLDAIDVMPEAFMKKMIKAFVVFDFETWSVLAVIFSLLFILFFLGYYFSTGIGVKKIFFILFIVFLLISLYSLNAAFYKYDVFKNEKFGIVFSESSNAKSEPNLTGETLFNLHEGTKVQVLEILDKWCEIKIPNGKTGWIRIKDIKII